MGSPDRQHFALKKLIDAETTLITELKNLPEYLKNIPKIVIEYFYREHGFNPSKPDGWVILTREEMNNFLIIEGSRNNSGNPQRIKLDKTNSPCIGTEDKYEEQREINDQANYFEIKYVDLPEIKLHLLVLNAMKEKGFTNFGGLAIIKKYVDQWPIEDTNIYCIARPVKRK
jgi:hypothetical protein